MKFYSKEENGRPAMAARLLGARVAMIMACLTALVSGLSFSENSMAEWHQCATEGGECKQPSSQAYLMRYGYGSQWAFDLLRGKPLACSFKVYGDVAPNRHKTCEVELLQWSVCASQGGSCAASVDGYRLFRYGPIAQNQSSHLYAYKFMAKGEAIKCDHYTHGDPAPNIVKHCQVAVLPGPLKPLDGVTSSGGGMSSGGVGKKYGEVDPIRKLIDEVPAAKSFLQHFVGVIQLTGAEGADASQNQLFKISGQWDRSKYGGNSALGKVIKQVSALTEELGAPNPVKVEVSLTDKNAEYDLAFKITMQEGWYESIAIAPEIEPKFIFKDLNLVLHGKMNQVTRTPDVTTELTGTLFAQPTKWDSWLGLTPSLELQTDGTLTFGGEISGACGGKPNSSTDPSKSCKKAWDVMSLGVVDSRGGVLKLSVTPSGQISGIEAAINKATIAGKRIDGALLVDVDMTPGAGLVLKAPDGQISMPGLYVALMKKMPGLSTIEPFKTVLNGISVVEREASRVTPGNVKDLEIIIAPTGLSVGDTSVEGSVFKFRGSQFVMPFDMAIDTEIKGDILGLFKNGATAISSGKLRVGGGVSTIEEKVKEAANQVPVLGPVVGEITRTFNFKKVEATADLSRLGDAEGSIEFTVFSKNIDINVPVGTIFKPDELVPVIVEVIKNSAFELGKIVLKGLEEAGKFIANGASVAGTEVAKGVVSAYSTLESFASANVKSVSDVINGVADAVGLSSSDGRAWSLANDVFDRSHYIYAYGLSGVWTEGGNPQAHYRAELFDDEGRASKCLDSAPWFDGRYYLMKYPGLGSQSWITNCAAVARHWHDWGVKENRRGSAQWDPVYYLAHNQDVARHPEFGKSSYTVLQHWIQHGRNAGRKGSPQIWSFKDKVKVGEFSWTFFNGKNKVALKQEIHVCRALHDGLIVVGSLYMDDCEMGVAKTSGQPAHTERVSGVEILSAKNPQWLAKGAAKPSGKVMVSSMVDKSGLVRTVCRVKVGRSLHKSGDFFPALDICRISDSNTTKDFTTYDVLYAQQPKWEAFK